MSRVTGKPYFLYVLWSPSAHRFYIGISEDPEQRLIRHNRGLSFWTARYRPWLLVLTERFDDYRSARKRELQLKRQKSGQNFYRMTGLDPQQFARV
ncbi:MAG: GIY-YIG nuclease family protein [Acidobacteria bacterium]|nr:GIY-YIG nuclease family protein [Acidobacteriota bacterium]